MEGFFGIGFQELVMIAVVALIVLGPERLPATLREVAKFIRQIRNLTNEFTQQFGDDFKALEDLDPRRMLQQAINSIDEEEQAKDGTAKGKATPAKPAVTAKTTPAKATTAKTTSTSSTTATKPAAAKPVVATAGKSTAIPKATTTTPITDSPIATPDSTQAKQAETETGTALASPPTSRLDPTETPENQQRIAPPELVKSVQEQAETPASTPTLAVQNNGTGNEKHSSATLDAAAISAEDGPGAVSNTNGKQDH